MISFGKIWERLTSNSPEPLPEIDHESDAVDFLASFKKELDNRPVSSIGRFEQAKITSSGVTYETNIRPQPKEEPFQQAMRKVKVCPGVSLQCDSVSASKSKCGFAEFGTPSVPPIYYGNKHVLISGSFDFHKSETGCTIHDSVTFSLERDYNYDEDCSEAIDECISPVGHISLDRSGCGGSTCSETFNPCTDIHFNPATGFYNVTASCGGGLSVGLDQPGGTTTIDSTTSETYHYSFSETTSDRSYTAVTTLSTETLTSDLQDRVRAALPPYSGFGGAHSVSGQGTTCSATASLSDDETSYSIRRFKPRFNFSAAACAGMVLTYIERFTPTGGGSPSDTVRTWTATGGETSYDGAEVLEPASNGTTTITAISTNCEACDGGGTPITLMA